MNFFLIIFFMGLLFLGAATFVYFNSNNSNSANIFSSIFAIVGVLILIISFVTTYNSILYYYENKVLRKFGIPTISEVISKEIHEFNHNSDNKNKKQTTIYEYLIEYSYFYKAIQYSGAEYVSGIEFYEAIAVGDEAPILVLDKAPEISRIQSIKYKNQIKDRILKNQNTRDEYSNF